MRKFLGFLAAAGVYGVVSVLISAISLGISVYEHAHDQNVTAYILVVVGALVFCIGAFIAWLEENKKYEAEKAKHDEPNFSLSLETILADYLPASNTTSVIFAGAITNRGASSHAGGWNIRYQSHTIDVTVKYVSLRHDRVEIAAMGQTLVLKRNDLLPARCLPTVARGDTIHGRILFELPGDRREEIFSGNAMMWVGCYDNTARLTQCPFKSTPKVNTLQTYPDEEVL